MPVRHEQVIRKASSTGTSLSPFIDLRKTYCTFPKNPYLADAGGKLIVTKKGSSVTMVLYKAPS